MPISEADEAATSKEVALRNLRDQCTKGETMGVVAMYERAALDAGATVAECEAFAFYGRQRRDPYMMAGMYRVGSEKVASDIAREKGRYYGWSVFGPGGWYVGTREELERIGVNEIKSPV